MSASERLRELDGAMTPRGSYGWWFDGRDIFHKKPDTNLDQIVWPIPQTFSLEQQVRNEDTRGLVALRNALPLIVDCIEAAELLIDRVNSGGPTERREAAIQSALAALRNSLEKPT